MLQQFPRLRFGLVYATISGQSGAVQLGQSRLITLPLPDSPSSISPQRRVDRARISAILGEDLRFDRPRGRTGQYEGSASSDSNVFAVWSPYLLSLVHLAEYLAKKPSEERDVLVREVGRMEGPRCLTATVENRRFASWSNREKE
jgi:hypothetical protein